MESSSPQRRERVQSNLNGPYEEPLGQETFTEMSDRNKKIAKTTIVAGIFCVFAGINLVPSMTLRQVDCVEDYA